MKTKQPLTIVRLEDAPAIGVSDGINETVFTPDDKKTKRLRADLARLGLEGDSVIFGRIKDGHPHAALRTAAPFFFFAQVDEGDLFRIVSESLAMHAATRAKQDFAKSLLGGAEDFVNAIGKALPVDLDKLAAVIEHLGAATEGSEALDYEIASACGMLWPLADDGRLGRVPRRYQFTRSLDAAVTLYLRPPGYMPTDPKIATMEALAQRAART